LRVETVAILPASTKNLDLFWHEVEFALKQMHFPAETCSRAVESGSGGCHGQITLWGSYLRSSFCSGNRNLADGRGAGAVNDLDVDMQLATWLSKLAFE
jgi:hypothetical protein